MLIDAFIIGILVAKFRGGKFKDLLDTKIKGLWLIILSFAIQYATMFLRPSLLLPAVIVSYSTLLVFCGLNIRFRGMYPIIAGIVLNFLVMLVNGGRMPVEIESAKQFAPELLPSLLAGEYGKHLAMSDSTHLNFLGDIFYLHAPYPHPGIVSLGDIIFSIGVFIFIQKVMVKRRSPIQGSVAHGIQS